MLNHRKQRELLELIIYLVFDNNLTINNKRSFGRNHNHTNDVLKLMILDSPDTLLMIKLSTNKELEIKLDHPPGQAGPQSSGTSWCMIFFIDNIQDTDNVEQWVVVVVLPN